MSKDSKESVQGNSYGCAAAAKVLNARRGGAPALSDPCSVVGFERPGGRLRRAVFDRRQVH